jgi:phenylacetate-CoA ligase
MDVYGSMIRHVLWPAWERGVRRRPILSLLRELQRSERLSLDELHARQHRALAALLQHAYDHVPFYRRRFESIGAMPADISDLDQLAKLPPLTRAQAREARDSRCSRAHPLPVIRKTTGGTTGEPLVIRYDLGSEHWRQAIKLRGFGWAGYRVGDRALHYWGEATLPDRRLVPRLKRAADQGLKRERTIDCGQRGDQQLRAVVRAIERHRPRVLFCYAQAGADLARYVLREGLRSWEDLRVICGAEKLISGDRAVMTEAFGPHVFETYGCRETMLIATECEAHAGLHLSMENLIVELVVDEDGRERPAAPGELGEVVITDLHNFGMPFIRYKNGDLAVAGERARCACGRNHPRLAAVEGRETDTLRDREGRRVSGMVFNLIMSPLADAVDAFQAVQHGDRSITLKLVPTDRFDEGAAAHLRRNFDRYLPGLPIAIDRVAEIPLTRGGKRRLVIAEPEAARTPPTQARSTTTGR